MDDTVIIDIATVKDFFDRGGKFFTTEVKATDTEPPEFVLLVIPPELRQTTEDFLQMITGTRLIEDPEEPKQDTPSEN